MLGTLPEVAGPRAAAPAPDVVSRRSGAVRFDRDSLERRLEAVDNGGRKIELSLVLVIAALAAGGAAAV
jgi:hypothetical protein